MALGMVEVYGFITGIAVADLMAKSADVKIVSLDKNKPAGGDSAEVPLLVTVYVSGNVSDVTEAVAIGEAEAKRRNLYVTSNVIGREEETTMQMAHICAVGKDKFNNK